MNDETLDSELSELIEGNVEIYPKLRRATTETPGDSTEVLLLRELLSVSWGQLKALTQVCAELQRTRQKTSREEET